MTIFIIHHHVREVRHTVFDHSRPVSHYFPLSDEFPDIWAVMATVALE